MGRMPRRPCKDLTNYNGKHEAHKARGAYALLRITRPGYFFELHAGGDRQNRTLSPG